MARVSAWRRVVHIEGSGEGVLYAQEITLERCPLKNFPHIVFISRFSKKLSHAVGAKKGECLIDTLPPLLANPPTCITKNAPKSCIVHQNGAFSLKQGAKRETRNS